MGLGIALQYESNIVERIGGMHPTSDFSSVGFMSGDYDSGRTCIRYVRENLWGGGVIRLVLGGGLGSCRGDGGDIAFMSPDPS